MYNWTVSVPMELRDQKTLLNVCYHGAFDAFKPEDL